MKLQLHKTCEACPEQYDAYYKGEKIAYLRLRHGWFRVDTLNGETGFPEQVFQAYPKGDGRFLPEEREFYLNLACLVLLVHLITDTEQPETVGVMSKLTAEGNFFEFPEVKDEG